MSTIEEAIIQRASYLIPPVFPKDYLIERLRESVPKIPFYRIGNIVFTTEVRDGEFYAEYIFGLGEQGLSDRSAIRDVLKTYAFIGRQAMELGYDIVHGDATPERVQSYRQIMAKVHTSWVLPVFLKPVSLLDNTDERVAIDLPFGSCRLDLFRAYYIAELDKVDIRDMEAEELERLGNELLEFLQEAGAVVFFGGAMTILELAKWLRAMGFIRGDEASIREHYIIEFPSDVVLRKSAIKRHVDNVYADAELVLGGKEYECKELFG